MVRTSAQGSAIHTTPTGAVPQQTSGNVGVCQDYLNTLIKQAQVQPPQTLKNVLDMIQGLIDNKMEPQTFTKKIQVVLPSSKQLHSELPYLEPIFLPFLKTNLPGLRQALTANTMTIDGVTAPPVAVIHQEVSMATRVHPSVPPRLSTQHAAAVGGPHIADSSARKRVKKTGEEVPSKKLAIEVVDLTRSPKETVTSDVSIPQESQTKAGMPTTKQQENAREVPCERPDIEMVDLTPSSIETVTSNVSIPQESQTKQDHLSNGKELSGEGSKENYQSSSSVSALEEKSKHKTKKKFSASNSTMEDLDQLKVFYEKEPLEMNTFFEMVKSKDSERRTGRKIKETMEIFKQITEEQLGTFRIDLDDLTETKKQNHQNSKSQKQKVMRHITTSTDEILDDFSQKTVEKEKYKDTRTIRLLAQWTTAVTEFMQNCADVVHSILQPEMLPRLLPSDDEVEEKPCEEKPCEILYHNLFLSFSRIFLLRPRQQRKVQEKIGKNIVACVSDICFLQSLFQPCTDAPKLVLMCEVKRKEPFKHERPQKTKWIEKKIDPSVMGQIGMELLCESTGSFFSPSVAGIACLRSEIMFLFLDIAKDHHQAIKDDASLDGKHAKIFYTETYDILKPEDRSKFMDILLYFAAIQSCNFIYPL